MKLIFYSTSLKRWFDDYNLLVRIDGELMWEHTLTEQPMTKYTCHFSKTPETLTLEFDVRKEEYFVKCSKELEDLINANSSDLNNST